MFRSLFLILVFGFIQAHALPYIAGAQDILIVRPLSNNPTESEEESIVFEAEVSGFEAITEVKINGQPLTIEPGTYVKVAVPIRLQRGANRVIIDATTEFESAHEEFVINFKYKDEGIPEEEDIPPFTLISMAGMQTISNPLSLTSDQVITAGTKSFLIFIPTFDWVFSKDSTLQFQGILSREKFDKEEFEALEIEFTQGSASWIESFGEDSYWKTGVGYNYIDQTFDGLFSGKTHLEEDSFLFGEVRWQFNPEHALTWGVQILNKNMELEAEDPEFEEDATAATLKLVYDLNRATYQAKAGFEYTSNDAVGKFIDETSQKISGEFSYLIGDFILSAKAANQTMVLTEPDPATMKQVTKSKTAISFTANYLISATWIINADILSEGQASNNDPLVYKNTAATLALIYLFQ